MDRPQDWTGYDFLKADLDTDAKDPIELYVEIHDTATRDYWTRVNYVNGRSAGPEHAGHSREAVVRGREVAAGADARTWAASPGWCSASATSRPRPLLVGNLRLERDDSLRQAAFAGLYAFDFGTSTSPVMEGFTPITPGTLYSKGRGYGLKNAHIWRAFDVLQPDPLYQDFICIESGGLAVDLPNGRYRVFVNIDNPSGFWGEYQVYRRRAILAQGKPVVSETMDFDAFQKKYYRFWNVEDLPGDNTFDKYQKAYFHEKTFDVDVTNGQLKLDFQGENWACSVSAVVIFPVEKAAAGRAVPQGRRGPAAVLLRQLFQARPAPRDRRSARSRPPRTAAAATSSSSATTCRTCTTTTRRERTRSAGRSAARPSPGEYEPLTVALCPLADLGQVTVTAGDLVGPAGTIPAAAIDVGYVSYRISRVTMEGSVYTISPRLIMPGGTVEMPEGVTRRFWLTVKTPADRRAGPVQGRLVTITPEHGACCTDSRRVPRPQGDLGPGGRARRAVRLHDQHALGRRRSGRRRA